MEDSKFFVWNPSVGRSKVVHTGYASALKEAKRIAELEPDTEILVLCVVTGVMYPSKPFIYRSYI